jgi:CelD/BcsL family acetyltransferase involved in cellulose biosynthesis
LLDVRTTEAFPRGAEAKAWEALVDADPAATVFHSARFLRLWCRHLRGECDLRIRLVSDAGTLVGVVPEVREVDGDRRVVHFAGGPHVTDYLGPVSLPDRREEVVRAWIETLVGEGDWDVLIAGGAAEDGRWHELVAEAAERIGLAVEGPDVDDVCPRIDLSGGWDGYLERLSSKQRHEIRRKARRLARETEFLTLTEIPFEEIEEAVDTFVCMHRSSPGDKGEFFDRPGMKEFFHGLVVEFGPERTLRMHRLDVDGHTAAMTVSLVLGGKEWGLYNSAYEQHLSSLSPGLVLVGELIRIAADEGSDIFDLLRGAESYKYRLGAADRRIMRVAVTSARGGGGR